MKSRKKPSEDRTQSSLVFFFGKRAPGNAQESEPSHAKSEPDKKKVDSGNAKIAKSTQDVNAAGRRRDGHRPQGGHLNPGRSRFFARTRRESQDSCVTLEKDEANSDSACGNASSGAVDAMSAPLSQQVGEKIPGEIVCDDIDKACAAELLVAAESDEKPLTIDLTEEPVSQGFMETPVPSSDPARRVPYYLENFRFILDSVLGDDDNTGLLDEADMKIVNGFLGIPDDAQKLYVRLHNRRKGWLRAGKLDYSEIGSDLTIPIDNLSRAGLLETEESMTDLETMLRLLPAPNVKEIAKKFHIQSGQSKKSGHRGSGSLSTPVSGKQDLVASILRHCRSQLSVFSSSGTEAPIRKQAKVLLGKCVQVPSAVRSVFTRLVHLFAVASWLDDDSQLCNASSTVIYNLLLSSNGSVSYPKYTVYKETRLFPDRDSFLRFCSALELESDVLTAKENGQWSSALEHYNRIHPIFTDCLDRKLWAYAAGRPQFLLRFTDGWVLCRVMSQCVDVLERHRMYECAVSLLRRLLDSPFCMSSRGRWYDRLALDLDQHLKQRVEALNVIEIALKEECVVTGHRLALQQRASRLCTAASATEEIRQRAEFFPSPDLSVAKEIEIRGHLYPSQAPGSKSYFMCNYSDTGMPLNADGPAGSEELAGSGSATKHVALLSVEELALEHYRCVEGFDCGIHAEGSSFSALFGLFMWDIIFDDTVADVFRNAYQAMPLDFYTAHFFESRRVKIEHRIEELQQMDSEMIASEVARVWSTHYGTYCGCLNWELFADVQQATDFCKCVGSPLLAGICSLLAEGYRHRRGGLPDLTLWSNKRQMCKFVEVKGPNDRLSHKQHVWMHHLVEMGADVEVCHVRAVGGRMR